MRKFVALISMQGKTPEEISEQAMKAFNKYNKVDQEVSKEKDVESPESLLSKSINSIPKS